MPQIFTQIRLAGKGGSSYCMRNYEIMHKEHPLVTRYYLDYSAWWFVIGLLGSSLLKLVVGKVRHMRMEKGKNWLFASGLLSALLMIFWYTFRQSGLWDPKNALFVGMVWILLMMPEGSDGEEDLAKKDGGIQ